MNEINDTTTDWITSYLRDHLAAAGGGVKLFERVAESHSHPEVRKEVAALAIEVAEDRQALRDIAQVLGVAENLPVSLLAMIGERVARLKPNGNLVKRSRGADLLELEALSSAVQGKSRGWIALRPIAARADVRLDPGMLDELYERAVRQRDRLEALHSMVAETQGAYEGHPDLTEEQTS